MATWSAVLAVLALSVLALMAAWIPPASGAEAQGPATTETPWGDAVLYFVMIDRFADGDSANNLQVDRAAKGAFHGGDLKGLRAHLDEIAGLGVTALWITPVVKNIDGFVTGAGFPDWAYHGYWADDVERCDPRFGGEDDLKGLVDDCHARGIRVLLDVVYNHAGYGSRYLSDPRTSGWLRSSERGGCGEDDLTSCVSGLPDWRTERPEVAKFLLDAQLGLARRTGVDGFRLDTFKHIDHPFWQEHRQRSRSEIGPGFFLLGEVWGGDPRVLDPWFERDELDAGFDFSFQGSAVGFLLGRGRTVAFDRYLKSREKIRPGYLVAHYLSSHDTKGALAELEGDLELFRLAAVLQFTSVGIPVICWGEEVGKPVGEWPDNREDMPWGDRPILPGAGRPRVESLREDYRRLIALRRAHPALSRGAHRGLATAGDLLVYEQADSASGDAVVVAINRGAAEAGARIGVPPAWRGTPWRDLWNDQAMEAVAAGGDSLDLSVPARSARIVGCVR